MGNRGSSLNARSETARVLSRPGAVVGLTVFALIAFAGFCTAQTQPVQQGGSLADAARQARAQKTQSGDTSDAQSRAQEVANELSEDQNDTGAPGGFKTYNAGDYELWVPAPYRIDGHDDSGIVLSGPQVGSKRPIVMVGSPVAVHWHDDDAAFEETATKFSHLYSDNAHCSKTAIASHVAYQCSLAAGNLLGTHITGNAVFVQGSGSMYPVFCVTPSDSFSRDYINDRHSLGAKERAEKNLSREEDDARAVFTKCDTVFQSFHLRVLATKKDLAPGTATSAATVVAAKTSPPPTAAPSTGAASQDPQSAAQAAPVMDVPPASTIPAGSKVHAFNYCKSRTECWNASVLVPVDAQLVSSTCKQYAFETKVQGTAFMLMAGPAAGDCDGNGGTDLVRWKQLVDPENKRAPGTYSLISSLNTTLAGRPAVITTMSFRKGLDSWMGKRAELENNGVPLVVGCMAPRDHFADGDAVCTKLIESLVLP